MTNKEAIKTLRELWRTTNDPWYEKVYEMAINALTAQPETHEERTETHGVCLDTIDRQAVLDWLKNEWNGMVTSLFDGIKALPSAQIIRCKECKHYIQNIHCVGGLYNGCEEWEHDGCEYPVEEDWFCIFAERRTDDLQ